MVDAETLYNQLRLHIASLEEKFLKNFLTSQTANPGEYDLSVRAYCVLSHAALEEYLENVALYVMHQSVQAFLMEQKCNNTLLTLVSYYRLKLDLDVDENSSEKKAYDYLRLILEKAKSRLSDEVARNQGFSIKYMRKLLVPVAVDIQEDANLKNSIMQLAKQRGTFAHKGAAIKVLSPEDAKGFVTDCLKMCEDIKVKTTAKFA